MHHSFVRLLLLVVPTLYLVPTLNAHAEPAWTEVRSPHFRVLTDGSSRDGRNVANEFEQMRHVLALQFHNDAIEGGAPLTIIAARDAGTFRTVDPVVSKAKGGDNIAGVFHRGWEKQFAVVRLDTWTDNGQVVVYHEYTHSVLHANAHWLPVWLDEGYAEIYAYTRFQNDHIYVGAPSLRMRELQNHPLIPVSTMLEVNSRSPYYHDSDKVQLFYAEAWAMVHYMTFGPNMEAGAKLNRFFAKLQEGAKQQAAFQEIFGDPHAFDQALSHYLDRFTFTAGVLPPDRGIDPKSFSERRLTPAETDYELGSFHIATYDRANGSALIEKALALDPALAGAHEELGFIKFASGQDIAALAEWKQAVALDPTRFRALFALTMTNAQSGDQTPAQVQATQVTLRHITELAPRFAPVFVELAIIEWQQGSLQQAYKDAHQAEKLEPWRAGYRILTGRILLAGHQPALAAETSRYVATHRFGPDHNEAVDLWQAVPANLRGDGPPLAIDMPAGAEVIRGVLSDVSCSQTAGAHRFTVQLTPDTPANAKPITFSSDGRHIVGFSDTLWWGEDHFNECNHLVGLPAIIAYKPQGVAGGELTAFEVRDRLPTSTQPQPPPTAEAASSSSPHP